jgi:hypothetical protein
MLTELARYESTPVDNDGDRMADNWEVAYFGGTDSVDGGPRDDWDQDGSLNVEEYVAGTDPTNSLSRLRMSLLRDDDTQVVIRYHARPVNPFDAQYGDLQRTYWLEHTSDGLDSDWHSVPHSTTIPSQDGVIHHVDTVSGEISFYRVAVRLQ